MPNTLSFTGGSRSVSLGGSVQLGLGITFKNRVQALSATALDFKNGNYSQIRTRTNFLRNSTMQGAVVRTLDGSGNVLTPGTLPTGWDVLTGTGLQTQVVALGTENGYPYIDIRIVGTPSSLTTGNIHFGPITDTPAVTGQTWALGLFYRILDLTTPPLSFRTALRQYSSASAFLADHNSATILPLTTRTFSAFWPYSIALTNASAAYVRPSFGWSYTALAAQDFTIRIYAPQMELASKPTAFIPTSGAVASVSESVYVTSTLRENLLLWSNDLSQANWGKTDTTITYSDAIAAHTGEPLAKVTEGSGASALLSQSVAGRKGSNVLDRLAAQWTVKRGNNDWWRFRITGGVEIRGFLNLATGETSTSVTGNGSIVSFTAVNQGNGIYLVTLVGDLTPTSTGSFVTSCNSASGSLSAVRVAGAFAYIGRCQLEFDQASPYIGPTNGTSVAVCCDDGPADLYGYNFSRAGARGERAVDGSLIFEPRDVPNIVPGVGLWMRTTITNLLLSSAVLATQNVTVTAQAYILSFFGTGTITLSGTATGTLTGTGANDRVSLAFTPTAGTLTLTVSGTVSYAVLQTGSQLGGVVASNSSSAATGTDVLYLNSPVTADEDFVLWATAVFAEAAGSDGRLAVLSDGTTSNRITLYRGASNPLALLVTIGGSSVYSVLGQAQAAAGRSVILVRRRAGKYTLATKTSTGSVAIAAESGDVAFPPNITRLDVGQLLGSQLLNGAVELVNLRKGTFSDADLTAIMSGA